MDSTIRGASLHRLKDHGDVCSKRRMAAAAAETVDGLDGIFEATRRAVHVRSRAQGFQLMAEATRLSPEQLGVSKSRPGEIRPSEETFLEFAVLDAWRAGSTGTMMPWERLVGRQVPLMSRRESEGWGSMPKGARLWWSSRRRRAPILLCVRCSKQRGTRLRSRRTGACSRRRYSAPARKAERALILIRPP